MAIKSAAMSLRSIFMVTEIFPRTTKVTTFPTSGWFSHIHAIAPLSRHLPKIAKRYNVRTNAPQYKVTFHCLSCLLANSNNEIKRVSAIPEWYNCQLLQPVHEFVEHVAAIQQIDVDQRWFTIPLTSSSSSQIHSHPVYHLKTPRFAVQLYALSS